jgi:hypothetical protein
VLWTPAPNGTDYSATPFDLPGYDPDNDTESCTGINGLGQIVGAVGVPITDANGNSNVSYTAFRGEVENGVPANFSPIFASSALNLDPYAINNNGLIAGTEGDFVYGGSATNGLLLNGPEIISVSIPGAYETYIYGLNDDVQLLGMWRDESWYNGENFILDIPH